MKKTILTSTKCIIAAAAICASLGLGVLASVAETGNPVTTVASGPWFVMGVR